MNYPVFAVCELLRFYAANNFSPIRPRNCHSALRKMPKERRSHLHRGRNLKSLTLDFFPPRYVIAARNLDVTVLLLA